ncbi:UDP-2-acetamido-3-amino-2,3-dideoxy-glucuronate N-acetyltransferase [Gelidibacter algens]|uniref:UDP-2-acetamido-3-amino-2,3-dideoxy-glucuronate N-acetyltransferase n=1 Tax=Gelidibacter algens TaxID=49280 RepID=A0A1A7R421_9FLAO|nr:acyltransferase [Gelidibacter algens]OBX25517.1 hexapeptide transferase [Gelidibacter algens]RAJ22243.1 UDP-2-acetamido-3-amino-2,3-dideoxy-glucuronate N-acetyltransferase [Gelidibacter algens]
MSDFFVHDSSYIDADVTIGKDTKIWHFSHIMAHTTIGDNCSFGQNCVVGPNVVIGNNVKVQNNISIYEGVEVEDDVFIGPSVVFTNVINPRSFIVRKQEFRKTLLKKGVSIGANATIICGNTLGEYAFIGSGTVVTKDVPNFALVVGNPGRRIGWVSRVGHMLTFNEQQVATCPETGETYQLKEDEVVALRG